MSVKISIVMPLYNKQDYVLRAVQSVLGQTYQDFEIVIIDDGSTDESVHVVRKIVDSRIKLIQQENHGVSAARNRGLHESSADLIAFLDADDTYKPDFLMKILQLEDKYPDVGAYAMNFEIIDCNSRKRNGTCFHKTTPFILDLGMYFKLAKRGNPIASSAIAVKRTVFDVVGGFPVGVKLGEDIDMWIRIIFSYSIAFDPRVGATYFENMTNRACIQNPPVREPYFFRTIDDLCVRRTLSQEILEDIREFKNFFVLLFAVSHIQQFSQAEGRKAFLECRTKDYIFEKWKWIIVSFVPRPVYSALRVFKRNIVRILTLQLGSMFTLYI